MKASTCDSLSAQQKPTLEETARGCEGLSLITVPIQEGEARVRGQLAYDNPNVAMV